MLEITISMEETGEFNINISEGLPLFTAIGVLEIAKNILITDNANSKLEKEVEQITEKVQ